MSLSLLISLAVALQIPTPTDADELKAHIERWGEEVESASRPFPKRVAVLLEIAAALDRAALDESDPDKAIERWREAVARLDQFAKDNDDRDKEPILPIRLQSAIYVWAEGRSWANRAFDAQGDPALVAKAKASYENVRKRLSDVLADAKDCPLVLQNGRFRLAQALSDLSELEMTDREARRAAIEQAIQALDAPIDQQGLAGFAELLRIDLLRRIGRLDEAKKAWERLETAPPLPPEADRIPVLVELLDARTQFDEALKRIAASSLPPEEKAAWRVKVRLAQRSRLGAGSERDRIETLAIEDAEPLRGRDSRQSRTALMTLAGAIDLPGSRADCSAFELLAEGHGRAGRFERSADLLVRGAERSASQGKFEHAADLRLRAGATLFRQGLFQKAEVPLHAVIDDPKAGSAAPKASLLRILTRDRGTALRPPTASRESYRQALESHLAAFPADPTSGEVRWRLGREYRNLGKGLEAAKLWASIPVSDPRWLDAQLALADELERDLIQVLPIREPALVQTKAAALRERLETSRKEADDPSRSTELTLRLARLDLLPIVGRPDEARQALEELLRRTITAGHQVRARLLLVIALAESHRVIEAEAKARIEAKTAEVFPTLDAVRLLDRYAAESDSELSRVRAAAILKILMAPLMKAQNEVDEATRQEIRLRQARAFALAGEQGGARLVLASSPITPPEADDSFLRDLADVYMRIEAFSLAVDVERLRSRNLKPATPPWFDARLGLAVAYYRARRFDDARQIIESTAILHPELGGGVLKSRFDRLRRKLASE